MRNRPWPGLLMVAAIGWLAGGCPAVDPGAADDDDAGDDDDASGDDDTDGCDGEPAVTDIDVGELAAMLDGDEPFALINTHVPNQGEIPGTDVHISYLDVDGLVDYLGDDLSVVAVVYCMTGPMSASAARELVDRGYCNILDLPGGMRAWEDAGYTLDP